MAIDMESDPVANGWVASLARPGGNVTGFLPDLPDLGGRRLEQLEEVVPGLSTVAVLWDAVMDRTPLQATQVSARAAGLLLLFTLHCSPITLLSVTALQPGVISRTWTP